MINESAIERGVNNAVAYLENADKIYFTFETERTEFIETCIEEVILNYETSGDYLPNYKNLVLEIYNENDY